MIVAMIPGAAQEAWAANAEAERHDVLIDACDELSGWRSNPGREFPGADGKVSLVSIDGDRNCIRYDFDFTKGGRYAGLERTVDIPEASRISFLIRAEGITSGMVRLRDGTNQEHAGGFSVKEGEWQRVAMDVDAKTFPGHWHGVDDGKFHFPLVRVVIAAHPKGAGKGHFLLRDLRVTTRAEELGWRITIATPMPGNIAFVEEGEFPVRVGVRNCSIRRHGVEVSCRLLSCEGSPVLRGVRRLDLAPSQKHVFKFDFAAPSPGYYAAEVDVVEHGKRLASVQGGIGVVRRPLNLDHDDPESFFGIHASDPAAAARIGAKWNRANRAWWWVEGVRGSYYLPDESIEQCRRNHILIMLTLHYGPPGWATELLGEGEGAWPPPPVLTEHWQAFVRYCARHYRENVSAFEIQNEPDLTCWWQKKIPFEDGVESYVRIVRSALPALKEIAPEHPIAGIDVSGGDYRSGLRYSRAIMRQVGDAFDVYTGHPYASPRYFGPERRAFFPFQNGLAEKLENSKRMIAEFGGGKRIWIGEKGWGLSVDEPPLGDYSRAYADCLVRALATARSVPDIDRFFWFLQRGCNESGHEYGLWRGDDPQPLPAAVAYAATAHFLYHVSPVGRLPTADRQVVALCFECSELGRGVVVAWSTGEDSLLPARLPVDAAVYDVMGRECATRSPVLSRSPVFIVCPLGRFVELRRLMSR